jgi:hypothetical protein
MTYRIGEIETTQITPFPNTIATGYNNPDYCGANTFSFSPQKAFLTL